MTLTVIPPMEPRGKEWPTLGPHVCDWIEANLVHGPGDLKGRPVQLDDEKRALIYRLYEVWPEGTPRAGRRRFLRACISLRKGVAKALALDTPVATPRGWTTIGDIQPGDQVFDESGVPRNVIAASPVFLGSRCFEVRFRDGSVLVADAEHRWFTQELRHRPYVGSVKTTLDLAASVVLRPDGALNHRIPVASALQLPEADLPVDPWVLGAWLGDGRADDSEFSLHRADLENFKSRVRAAGYYCGKVKPDRRSEALAVRVSTAPVVLGGVTKRDSLVGRLRTLGLLGNKHVPASYLRASAGQRLALLQGLMDTDGTIGQDGNCCVFTSTTNSLAHGVFELVASLGMKPSLRPQRSMCVRGASRVPGVPSWRVTFHAPRSIPVFTLERKLGRQRPAPSVTPMSTNRHITAVVEVPSVPTRCIAVDSPSHLFLAGRALIPTHNTELGALIAAAELSSSAPVRCAGFGRRGKLLAASVTDPYVPLVAYTEEQSDELAYGALRQILEASSIAAEFDIGLERIMRIHGDGKAESVSSSPDARDGARTSFMLADETHRLKRGSRAKAAHKTMLANLGKRAAADAWCLEITTAPAPGEGSVAEDVHDFARQVEAGKVAAPTFFFFHREAGPEHVIYREDGTLDREALEAAIIDASGPAAAWSDIHKIADQFTLPGADVSYLERVWLNRLVQAAEKAFDLELWARCAAPGESIPAGALVTLGFDGARTDDSTALVATDVATGLQELLGLWERPTGKAGENWRVDEQDVNAAVESAFERFNVWRLYADPPYWESTVAAWSGKYGEERVIAWATYRYYRMAHALRAYANGIEERALRHASDARLARHVGNAHRRPISVRDEQGRPMWVICKARSDSPEKIDACMASVLSWQARLDALAAGAYVPPAPPQSYAVDWIDA